MFVQIDKATYLEHFDRKGISGDSLLQFERMFDAMDYKGTGKLNFVRSHLSPPPFFFKFLCSLLPFFPQNNFEGVFFLFGNID